MTAPNEMTLEVSFPKALLLSGFSMICFVGACYLTGIPMVDPLLVGFLVVMVVVTTPLFAVCSSFMLRCKIGHEGFRPAVPTFYQRVLRWEDIVAVRKFVGVPFYVVLGRQFGAQVLLPSGFLLKRSDSLRLIVDQFAPAGNIVRIKLSKK